MHMSRSGGQGYPLDNTVLLNACGYLPVYIVHAYFSFQSDCPSEICCECA